MAEDRSSSSNIEIAAEGGVRWAVNTALWTPSDAQFNVRLAQFLPPSELSSVLRFSSPNDRRRAFVSRLMQRKLLHDLLGIEYESICLERTPEGKPYLANRLQSMRFPDLSFNVSHHGDYVVIVSDPVSPMGVDITTYEKHFDLHPEEVFEVYATFFTPFEWKTIRSGGPDSGGVLAQFYRHWCMKEAYIKALGIGLGFELHRAEFHYHEDLIWGDLAHVYIDGAYAAEWQFFLHKLDAEHWVCVAKGPPSVRASSGKSGLCQDIDDGKSCSIIAPRDTSFSILRVEDVLKQMSNGSHFA